MNQFMNIQIVWSNKLRKIFSYRNQIFWQEILSGASYATHTLLKFKGTPVLVSVGCGLPCPGYTLICDESVAGELFAVLAERVGDEEILLHFLVQLEKGDALYLHGQNLSCVTNIKT